MLGDAFALPVLLGALVIGCSPVAAKEAEQDDPTRPVTTWDFRSRYEDTTVSSRNDRLTLIFRRNNRWNLDGDWKLATRLDGRLVFSDRETDANPSGGYRAGLGRMLVQAIVADVLDDRWAVAAGGRIVTAASASNYGSGNWDLVPILEARAMLPEISEGSYFLPEARYAVSIGRSFGSRPANELQFSPELKLALSPQYFVVLFPSTDIRVNFGRKVAGQTGRLFLPLDGEIGCNLSDSQVLSLEVSAPVVRDYPLYRLKIEARFSLRL
jgi:hypothetical protein